ncbi:MULTISPECIES: CPBP family intramembrane glutamic endopeptidase [Eubacteriales]|uniref:CAAX protease self-immunity n=1 Tax=Bittarella massiliensis (ex Durand et al. 2017) TaxID=1720313 RepID=A0AAQ1MG25_9FIRM|nr:MULTISPECIES: CPBP family intramembrane glutamic endopeptidase [Eubacteriales]ERI99643.1 CAAX amino terminal protease family protein [Clostridium sp. ATCC 29733]MZL68330.1 CPBP family intramembrane metalloprotease [Bittarella massiliensis (ex Durand et al. 2017)]MZL79615.1 CPBP family intramembrane metalloprotease [Bittarella massiliensis (ex Durand et al. 2017)]SHG63184.1 CAAX protease self-immunity [Bittarella massiliensis (ex Durand et al. 2017)]
MSKKTISVLTCLCILIAAMDISGLPGILFQLRVADVDAAILPLTLNFCLIGLAAFAVIRIFKIEYKYGFTTNGLLNGLKKYAPAGAIAGILSFIAFFIGLSPFDYKPTIWKVLIEGVVYYIGVGIVEEFYVRGLFLNIVEALCKKRKNKTAIAIVVSSIAFGLGHIPGVIGMGWGVILFKVISTIGMGFYFGVIYKRTNNLLLPILMHIFIDVCALPYCFTSNMRYETISLIILVITYTMLAVYSGVLLGKADKAN